MLAQLIPEKATSRKQQAGLSDERRAGPV